MQQRTRPNIEILLECTKVNSQLMRKRDENCKITSKMKKNKFSALAKVWQWVKNYFNI